MKTANRILIAITTVAALSIASAWSQPQEAAPALRPRPMPWRSARV